MAKIRARSGISNQANASGISGEILGVQELIKQLEKLPAATGGKILRQSLRNAATPIRALAKLNMPEGDVGHYTYKGNFVSPGYAKRSLRLLSKVRRDGVVEVVLGVKAEAFYATQFVELGKNKKHQMTARPWLRPAFEAKQETFENRLEEALRKRILAAVR